MPPLFLVMLGGAIGAGFRYHISRIAMMHLGPAFPWGTWMINLLGGLLMGVLAGTVAKNPPIYQPLFLFLGTGVLGGFTTFSAFSLETFGMIQRGDPVMAACYAVSSVCGSVLLTVAGFALARATA
jgi:fluoride exporter